MAELIKGFQTNEGTKQYDYNSLANKPTLIELDSTLKISGKAADAKAVGDAISNLSGGNANIQDIVDEVLKALPKWTGGSY